MSYTYKIRLSYNDDTEDIFVDEDLLQFAYYAFMTESRIVLPTGEALRGKDIISITPDLVGSMGWNRGYKPRAEDWEDIRLSLSDRPRRRAEQAKLITERIIKENRPDLLGTQEARMFLLGSSDDGITNEIEGR